MKQLANDFMTNRHIQILLMGLYLKMGRKCRFNQRELHLKKKKDEASLVIISDKENAKTKSNRQNTILILDINYATNRRKH